jgi:hypothetical protein
MQRVLWQNSEEGARRIIHGTGKERISGEGGKARGPA